ncbi:hypothetical protein AB0K35_27805 [Micromonospora sp. NPDC053740]|uniref:hypothetical protein n=1 Tax=Micromonospora sp. NPDC053740 TaxID=3155173 RepID=UPI003421390C
MSITFAPAITGAPEVNMANGNAAQILDLLGYTFDGDWADASAEDFLGRVLIAQALLPVATDDANGLPAVQERNWTDCGRRPGYLADRLTDLHRLATWAVDNQAAVEWH